MLIKGILLGLTLSIMIGPVFFVLMQISMESGTKKGVIYSAGVWLSDFAYLLLIYFGFSTIVLLKDNPSFKSNMGIVGAIVLIIFGLTSALAKRNTVTTKKEKLEVKDTNPLILFFKGFIINALNPFTLFFWLGMVTAIMISENANSTSFSIFLMGLFPTIVLTDLLKINMAKKISNYLNEVKLYYLKVGSGVILLIFGLRMLYLSI